MTETQRQAPRPMRSAAHKLLSEAPGVGMAGGELIRPRAFAELSAPSGEVGRAALDAAEMKTLAGDPTTFAAMRADPERSFWFGLDRLPLSDEARAAGVPRTSHMDRWAPDKEILH